MNRYGVQVNNCVSGDILYPQLLRAAALQMEVVV